MDQLQPHHRTGCARTHCTLETLFRLFSMAFSWPRLNRRRVTYATCVNHAFSRRLARVLPTRSFTGSLTADTGLAPRRAWASHRPLVGCGQWLPSLRRGEWFLACSCNVGMFVIANVFLLVRVLSFSALSFLPTHAHAWSSTHHGQVHRGVCYDDTRVGGTRRLAIESVDAPLVSVGDTEHMMDFDNSQPDMKGGMHFNLHNNVGWDCSSPWWTDDDAQFTFRISLNPPDPMCGWS